MDFEKIKKVTDENVLGTYSRYPLALVSGKGSRVRDSEGKEYIDLIAGIASCPLGHAHPKLVNAISNQAEKLIHVSNLFYIEKQALFAERLLSLSGLLGGKVFFCNSGAEANESAIKFSRKCTGKRTIIAMSKSFHGRTMGSLAITDKKKYQKPFEPLMPETRIAEYGDLGALKAAIDENTAAVFTELVQGESGIKLPKESLEESISYFKEVEAICREKGVLLVIDEVQTGNGRTGTYFACEQFGISPDIITTAKGVAGGFPMGVVIMNKKVADCMEAGDHASTFGGSPLACAAGLANLEAILSDGVLDNVKKVGAVFKEELGCRGLGLMLGFELRSAEKANEAMERLRRNGVLVNVTGEKVIRMVPPLVITMDEAKEAIGKIKEAVE